MWCFGVQYPPFYHEYVHHTVFFLYFCFFIRENFGQVSTISIIATRIVETITVVVKGVLWNLKKKITFYILNLYNSKIKDCKIIFSKMIEKYTDNIQKTAMRCEAFIKIFILSLQEHIYYIRYYEYFN